VTLVDAAEGYRLWAPDYDTGPNPLLALETRLLANRLGPLGGRIFLDVAAGTGRWMAYARARGAQVFGFDLCPEMLMAAAAKRGLAGRVALADACELPLPDAVADFAVCSLALGYFRSLAAAVRELARVASRVVVSDLHPEALGCGWTRSFRAAGEVYQIRHHAYTEEELKAAAEDAGLEPLWRLAARFGEPERAVFRAAGKESFFDPVRETPALLLTAWRSR
jgi:SAM-dependent methyltransferase